MRWQDMSEVIYASVPCLCVVDVTASTDYTLTLTFSDGQKKLFDFKPLLSKNIYQELNNLNLFMKAETDGCGVIWNDDIDIDPTWLYEHGKDL